MTTPNTETECPVEDPKENEDLAKYLYSADPNCKHQIVLLWSGYKCAKCGGWYCA